MYDAADIEQAIFEVTDKNFGQLCLEVFRFQYHENAFYRRYADMLNRTPDSVTAFTDIPFLPIQFFKSQKIVAGTKELPVLLFESSGTTGAVNSKHYVLKPSLYIESFSRAFKKFYGDPRDLCIIGLLPSYLEKGESSLVYMVDHFVNQSRHQDSGFYLYDHEKLYQTLLQTEAAGKRVILFGVTYALLDFAEKYAMHLQHTVVMETGGMKGRRAEMTRDEVHTILKLRLGIEGVHSEYGMTELLSQGYSAGNGIFETVPWMKILLRSADDPFELITADKIDKPTSAVVNVIDLANLYSCSFIATDDLGKLYPDESFEILGRLDNSDIRGCGLMIL